MPPTTRDGIPVCTLLVSELHPRHPPRSPRPGVTAGTSCLGQVPQTQTPREDLCLSGLFSKLPQEEWVRTGKNKNRDQKLARQSCDCK